LVARDERTTNFSWANFGHVEDDDGGDETNTEAGNQTASDNKTETRGSSLENASNGVDDTPRDNGRSTTIPVSEITGNQSTFQQMLSQQLDTENRNLLNLTKESSSRENGGDERVVGTRQGRCAGTLDELNEYF
jgi:hypothetical protein